MSGSSQNSRQQSDQEKDQKNEKKDFGDSCRGYRNSSKTENRRYESDNKESKRPLKHVSVLRSEAPKNDALNVPSVIDARISFNTESSVF
jgi:hypothetical protein